MDSGMKEMHERLSYARSRAGFKKATEAARYYGWNENTYRSHENGQRGFKLLDAEKYAKAFGVSPGWLFLGIEDDAANQGQFINIMKRIEDPTLKAEILELALKRIMEKEAR